MDEKQLEAGIIVFYLKHGRYSGGHRGGTLKDATFVAIRDRSFLCGTYWHPHRDNWIVGQHCCYALDQIESMILFESEEAWTTSFGRRRRRWFR